MPVQLDIFVIALICWFECYSYAMDYIVTDIYINTKYEF